MVTFVLSTGTSDTTSCDGQPFSSSFQPPRKLVAIFLLGSPCPSRCPLGQDRIQNSVRPSPPSPSVQWGMKGALAQARPSLCVWPPRAPGHRLSFRALCMWLSTSPLCPYPWDPEEVSSLHVSLSQIHLHSDLQVLLSWRWGWSLQGMDDEGLASFRGLSPNWESIFWSELWSPEVLIPSTSECYHIWR